MGNDHLSQQEKMVAVWNKTGWGDYQYAEEDNWIKFREILNMSN
jgi:hypothetical protein